MTAIAGKVAVVTGAGSGIGMGLAKELGRRDVRVVVADIIAETAARVAAEIVAEGGEAVGVQCDVCERAAIREMKERADATFGTVQLLFANAGATSFDPLMKMSDDDVDWIIQVNLMGVMNTTRAFLPDMMSAGDSHIIATASMAGLLPSWIPAHVPYSAAKMGIIGMMRNLSRELEEFNVHTTIYCPGGVKGNMKENNATYRPERFGGPVEGGVIFGENTFKNKPIAFFTPDQIAPIVLRAVENDRAFVFDHAEQRRFFRETYVDVVEACYDDIDAYMRENELQPLADQP